MARVGWILQVKKEQEICHHWDPPGHQWVRELGREGQEGTRTHRSKISPQQWPKQGAAVWLKVAKEPVSLVGFPGGSNSKESTCNEGDLGLIPGLGRSSGGGHGNPLQYSCLENPHGQRTLAGYSSRSRKESDMTEWLSTAHCWKKSKSVMLLL